MNRTKVLRTYSVEEIQRIMFEYFQNELRVSDYDKYKDTLINTQVSINGNLNTLVVKIIAQEP